jgi:hypothetical protein
MFTVTWLIKSPFATCLLIRSDAMSATTYCPRSVGKCIPLVQFSNLGNLLPPALIHSYCDGNGIKPIPNCVWAWWDVERARLHAIHGHGDVAKAHP